MTAKVKAVKLGQEAYVVSLEGEVVRTMVGRIEENNYQLLNGDGAHHPHWFSFEEALLVAVGRINDRQDVLRREIQDLEQKSQELRTEGYKAAVMSASYRAADLRSLDFFGSPHSRKRRSVAKVRVPEKYLGPGLVYAIITPLTPLKYRDIATHRPCGHFVLETEVTSVCLTPGGEVHYTFSTPFVPEEFFSTRKEAETRLRSYSEPGHLDPIYFVSHKQEKEELEKLADEVPF